jgi:hypothetical protein
MDIGKNDNRYITAGLRKQLQIAINSMHTDKTHKGAGAGFQLIYNKYIHPKSTCQSYFSIQSGFLAKSFRRIAGRRITALFLLFS